MKGLLSMTLFVALSACLLWAADAAKELDAAAQTHTPIIGSDSSHAIKGNADPPFVDS